MFLKEKTQYESFLVYGLEIRFILVGFFRGFLICRDVFIIYQGPSSDNSYISTYTFTYIAT